MSGQAPGGRPPLPRGGPGQGGPMAGLSAVVEKPANFGATARRLLARLRPYRPRLIAVLAFAAISVAFTVVGPYLLGRATTLIFNGYISTRFPAGTDLDTVTEQLRADGQDRLADMLQGFGIEPGAGVDFDAVGRVLLTALVVYLAASLFSLLQARIMVGVTQDAMYELRSDVEDKLGRLPLRYFDTHARGDLLSRVTNDIDNIATTIQQVMQQFVTSVLTVVGVLVMMFWISPLLAVISLLTVPLSFIVTMAIARRSQPHFKDLWMHTGRLNGHVEEMTTGHTLVKVHNRQDWAIEEYEQINDELYRSSFKAQFISGIIQPTMLFIGNLNYVLIAVIGGLRVSAGQMPIGDVQAFIQYSRQFTMPITQIASVANLMQSGIASAERVFEFLDAAEEEPDTSAPAPAQVRGAVDFEGVHFRYTPERPLIHDLDLHVAPGRTIAIVGPTGAGKTTLINLLMRFYEVDAGRILLDGVPTAQMTRDEVRRSFAMVLQDTWLFGGTIADNIAYGRPGATREQVEEAGRAALVDHLVLTMPEGYDTVIDDEATNLSAGEKQLVTIARAFIADAPVLILDEATSSVDTRTEVLIQEAMGRLRAGRTSFVIAHRLSTIRDADTILVLVDGAIVEQGDHESLLQLGGHYADLHASQFAGVPG